MKNIINVFERHEIKYMITDEQRKQIIRGLEGRMIPDPHGESTICNVYYDTPDFRLIRRSLEKPKYKEKIRLRSYGTPKEGTIVFLELKKKYNGVVYKRRIELPEKSAEEYMAGKIGIDELMKVTAKETSPQIVKELDYFKDYYKSLKPSVYLNYDRCAYFSEEDESLRITFDKNIQWRTDKVSLVKGPGGKDLLKPDASLMEIKTSSAMPVSLMKILSDAEARPSSFSKYGRAYQEILANALNRKREIRERLGKDNDKYIRKHIYGRNTYNTGLHDKHSSGAGSWSADRVGIFPQFGPFQWVSDNGSNAAGNSSSNNNDGKRKHWSFSGGGRSVLAGEIQIGAGDR